MKKLRSSKKTSVIVLSGLLISGYVFATELGSGGDGGEVKNPFVEVKIEFPSYSTGTTDVLDIDKPTIQKVSIGKVISMESDGSLSIGTPTSSEGELTVVIGKPGGAPGQSVRLISMESDGSLPIDTPTSSEGVQPEDGDSAAISGDDELSKRAMAAIAAAVSAVAKIEDPQPQSQP